MLQKSFFIPFIYNAFLPETCIGIYNRSLLYQVSFGEKMYSKKGKHSEPLDKKLEGALISQLITEQNVNEQVYEEAMLCVFCCGLLGLKILSYSAQTQVVLLAGPGG